MKIHIKRHEYQFYQSQQKLERGNDQDVTDLVIGDPRKGKNHMVRDFRTPYVIPIVIGDIIRAKK